MEGRCRKPFLALIFAVMLTLLAARYCLNPTQFNQKTKKSTLVATFAPPAKSTPRQIITITSSNCYIEDFDYEDPRGFSSHDYSDVKIEVENDKAEPAKVVAVKRHYLGDAAVVFKLRGKIGHEGLFAVTNEKKTITSYYSFSVKFRQLDCADIVIMVRQGKITTIYQESPKLQTLFQYNGII